jgi:hypothetical protein
VILQSRKIADCRLPIADWRIASADSCIQIGNRQLAIGNSPQLAIGNERLDGQKHEVQPRNWALPDGGLALRILFSTRLWVGKLFKEQTWFAFDRWF